MPKSVAPARDPAVPTSEPIARRGQVHDLLHVRLPLRHQGASEGRRHPLHRGQPRPSGEPRRALRQGLGRDHAALLAGAAAPSRCCASARAAAASSARSSWDEALATADRMARRDPRAAIPSKLAFFTGRDQCQALTGWWASQFGTPNYAAHGGFCSVNMAAAGLYTIGGSFWEFGEPDWEHTRYFLLFGVAEDHDSNPIKIGLGKLQGARRQVRLGQSRCAPAIPRSPTNGSASGPAPTGSSCSRSSTSCCAPDKIDADLPRPLHQRALAGDRRSRRRR